MVSTAEQGGIDRAPSHAPNTVPTSVSNRFVVFTPAAEQPRPKIANNGATRGERNQPSAISDDFMPFQPRFVPLPVALTAQNAL